MTPGSPKASQNEAQSLPRTPKTQTFPHPGIPLPTLQVLPVIAAPTSHQLPVHRGPAAEGVALKIRRTPRRGAAGRDGIATEFPSKLGFRGHTPCRPPLTGTSLLQLENHQILGPQKKRSRAPKWSPSCTPAGTQNRQKREQMPSASSLGPLPEIAEKSVAFLAP